MSESNSTTGITLFFPVYNDSATLKIVAEKSIEVLSQLTDKFEIIIINDGSKDGSGALADQLAKEHSFIRVIHHEKNLGYGIAIRKGLENSKYEWICFMDGDNEYDVYDLYKLYDLKDYYDLIITFRYVKLYSGFRQFISAVYNITLRWLFRTRYRDISTGLRLMRKSLFEKLTLNSTSPFIGAELTIKSMLKGYRIGEVGIQTFPRAFGKGTSTSMHNIIATIKDMLHIYAQIFSKTYDVENRKIESSKGRAA